MKPNEIKYVRYVETIHWGMESVTRQINIPTPSEEDLMPRFYYEEVEE